MSVGRSGRQKRTPPDVTVSDLDRRASDSGLKRCESRTFMEGEGGSDCDYYSSPGHQLRRRNGRLLCQNQDVRSFHYHRCVIIATCR